MTNPPYTASNAQDLRELDGSDATPLAVGINGNESMLITQYGITYRMPVYVDHKRTPNKTNWVSVPK